MVRSALGSIPRRCEEVCVLQAGSEHPIPDSEGFRWGWVSRPGTLPELVAVSWRRSSHRLVQSLTRLIPRLVMNGMMLHKSTQVNTNWEELRSWADIVQGMWIKPVSIGI
jgi:hypothetical protein